MSAPAAQKPEDQCIIVCIPRSAGNLGGFDDNRYAPCDRCGVEIQHRPHVPELSQKVCLDCFVKELKPTNEVGVTIETLVDLERARLQ